MFHSLRFSIFSYLCFGHPYKEETYKPVFPPPSTLTRKEKGGMYLPPPLYLPSHCWGWMQQPFV